MAKINFSSFPRSELLLTESFSDLQFDSLQEWENSLVKRSQNIVKAITLVDPAKNDVREIN